MTIATKQIKLVGEEDVENKFPRGAVPNTSRCAVGLVLLSVHWHTCLPVSTVSPVRARTRPCPPPCHRAEGTTDVPRTYVQRMTNGDNILLPCSSHKAGSQPWFLPLPHQPHPGTLTGSSGIYLRPSLALCKCFHANRPQPVTLLPGLPPPIHSPHCKQVMFSECRLDVTSILLQNYSHTKGKLIIVASRSLYEQAPAHVLLLLLTLYVSHYTPATRDFLLLQGSQLFPPRARTAGKLPTTLPFPWLAPVHSFSLCFPSAEMPSFLSLSPK